MTYTKQTFTAGQTLKASDLNTMSQGIVDKQDKLVSGTSIKISYPNLEDVETLMVPVESITLSPTTLALVEGETSTVNATLTPSNTTQTSLKWESSNTSVATVSDGKVTALAQGSATITCKSIANTAISASVSVVVSEASSTDLTGLLISESTKTVLQGETTTLRVSYVPSATTQKGVTWSSDDTGVATVVGNGDSCTVTAVGGGQCNIIATSTVNNSIKTSCFFTTTAQSEGGDEGEASNYVLGANITYDASSNILTGSKPSGAYASQDNTAIYKVPLKAGMEVEIVQTIPSDYKTYIGWGVDDTTEISELTYANAKYPTGMFCFYIDSGKDNVQSLSYGSLTPRYELGVNGGKTSPRVSVIKRDASGNLSATFGGQAVTMPSHEGVTAANETENLYVWIGGIDSASTWKINYFGELH